MKALKKTMAGLCALCLSFGCISVSGVSENSSITETSAAEDISSKMEWGTLSIGGGGFVSGIVTGKKVMYARTDVGGAYKFNYETDCWEQLFGEINDADRGYLSVDAMAIDPTNEDTVYFLCGCAYFTDAKTAIFKTTDGGKSFERIDITDLIQVHGNGLGRQTGEAIAVDPDDPNTIYCGGDVTAGESCLIKSTDAGKTWKPVKSYDDLGLFKNSVKWPTWTNHTARGVSSGEYYQHNGVACIYIYGGKVYVGTSTTGKYNVVCASTKDDEFTDMSGSLDSAHYPGRITGDGKGNIYFSFQASVDVNAAGTAGSVKKLDAKTGKITDISPLKHLYRTQTGEFEAAAEGGYSGISIDPANPDHMVCSTCGLFANAQLWEPWTDEHGPCWGDKFFKSEDGGEHWIETTPGCSPFWGQEPIADYLDDGGYSWIRDKAIHWVGSYVIDPVKPDRSLSTSGNGVFACDDTWGDKPQFHFQPDGIEEVVSLDFVSTPDGLDLSAIGDYDGFVHESVDKIGLQYQPNMGSTSAIAVCPQNTDVWARIANGDGNNTGSGYYTTDRGKTWKSFKPAATGGKLAITELSNGKYRIINSSPTGSVSYSDDLGATWTPCTGIKASKGAYALVDPKDPKTVYISGVQYNEYWSSNPNLKEPPLEDAHYSFAVSTDYGATFTETVVCRYDMCDHTGDLAYLGDGTVIMATGWQGMYAVSDGGKTVKKLDSVFYAKCVGYGAPEKSGGLNTLFIYGKPESSDKDGIYRSTDGGKTWVCINTDHLYGGTGNGNYLVGDMDEFGKVYMSTVGCGIVYGQLSDGNPKPPVTTTTTKPVTTTTKKVTTTTTTTASVTSSTSRSTDQSFNYEGSTGDKDYKAGDANCDGEVDMSDAVLIMQALSNPNKYGLNGSDSNHITDRGRKNADCSGSSDGMTVNDATAIQKYLLGAVQSLPVK